jgi:hypothetical protein
VVLIGYKKAWFASAALDDRFVIEFLLRKAAASWWSLVERNYHKKER